MILACTLDESDWYRKKKNEVTLMVSRFSMDREINVRCNSYGVRVHFEVHSRSIYIYLFYPIAMEGKEKKNEVSFSNSSVFNKWMLDVV